MSTPNLQLVIDGVGALEVHTLRGKESISDAWRFDVSASGLAEDDATRLALGQRAKLVLNVGAAPREFNGVVSAVRLDEVNPVTATVRHSFRVVPRLWLLRNNQRTRIFQNKRIIDVVAEVLAAAQIAVRWTLVRSYPSREYCTQYEESDYAFVRRLLAEAGIYFRFYAGGPGGPSGLEALAGGAMAAAAAVTGGVVDSLLPLVPGDSVVCGDDALAYPSIGPEDPAALAAASTASLGRSGPLGAACRSRSPQRSSAPKRKTSASMSKVGSKSSFIGIERGARAARARAGFAPCRHGRALPGAINSFRGWAWKS